MAEPNDTGSIRIPASPSEHPLLVPVTAEDVARRKRRLFTIIGSSALVAALTGLVTYKLSTDPKRAREAYSDAEKLLATARYSQAIIEFDRAISLDSGYFEAYVGRGEAWANSDNPDRAVQDLSVALQLRPGSPEALLDRARIYLDLKEYQLGLDDAARAIARNPNLARAYTLRGRILRAMGNPRKALDDFTQAVEMSPDMDNLYERATTFELLGRHKEALADWNRVVAIDPQNAEAYYARSAAKLALGDTKGAEADHRMGRILDGQ